jgi:uncharacterized protein (UPF0335 family)
MVKLIEIEQLDLTGLAELQHRILTRKMLLLEDRKRDLHAQIAEIDDELRGIGYALRPIGSSSVR